MRRGRNASAEREEISFDAPATTDPFEMQQAPPPVSYVGPPAPRLRRPKVAPAPTAGVLAEKAGTPMIYWAALGVVVVGAGSTVFLLYRRFKTKMDEAEEAGTEMKVRAEEYARQRGADLARQQIQEYLRRNKGARHDVGDPGLVPDLACSSSFETPQKQRCAATGEAVTSSTNPIGIRLEPIPESGQLDLEGATEQQISGAAGNVNDSACGGASTATTANSAPMQQES